MTIESIIGEYADSHPTNPFLTVAHCTKAFEDGWRSRLTVPICQMTDDQKVAFLAIVTARAEKAEAELASAIRYRPLYAPGPTQREKGLQSVLRQAVEDLIGARLILAL